MYVSTDLPASPFCADFELKFTALSEAGCLGVYDALARASRLPDGAARVLQLSRAC